MLVYWLDILGTAVFAISGVLLAGKLRMDPFGVLVLGVPLGWLVAVHEFPGRRLFSWALMLPLAEGSAPEDWPRRVARMLDRMREAV